MKYIVKSSFHQRVGKLEDVKIIKQNGTFSLQVVLRKYKGALPKALTQETIQNTMFYQALNLLRINERDDLRIKKMFTGRPTVTGKLVVYYISSKFLKGTDLGQL